MKEQYYYTSLARNMILIIILVSLTPLILIAGLIGYYFETSYREKVMELWPLWETSWHRSMS
ncbi:MAG: hypothetical protein ABSF90_28420 [Syntrophobacteraceae bacterium]|jgi:two-component system NtrC family sensor kinase